jgi:hypothetical protein
MRAAALDAARRVLLCMESSTLRRLLAMSQENVEIVKEFTRLFQEGDRDRWRDYFDPDVVWDTSASDWPRFLLVPPVAAQRTWFYRRLTGVRTGFETGASHRSRAVRLTYSPLDR